MLKIDWLLAVIGRAACRTVTATAIIVGPGNGHGSAITVAIVSN